MIIIENEIREHNTVLDEIKYLRGMKDFLIDRRNRNRYRIIVKENLGYTAYCFSTPIYSSNSRKLVNMSFDKTKSGYSFKGSNGVMSVCKNRCVFENSDGRIIVSLKDPPQVQATKKAEQSNITVMPTLNGLKFAVKGKDIRLLLKSETRQDSIRFNQTCFSVMNEKFKPFLTVAALFANDEKGRISPVEMQYKERGGNTYEIEMFNNIENGTFVFEINLYEPKLFQDTTVESSHPDINNVYGAIGFIGKTKHFGEQWMYSRPDFDKIPDLTYQNIDKVLLHIPILNRCEDNVDLFVPIKRFCSFGSTWNNKIDHSEKSTSSGNDGKYLTIDVTTMFTDKTASRLVYNEGFVLKKQKGKNNFIAISTGDSYSAPQILEIKFK